MPVRLPGRASLAIAAAALASACSSDLPIPAGIRLTCEDGGCPAGFTCVPTALPPSCVPSDQLGSTPEVTGPSVTPGTARQDVDVRVQFTASKALGKDPVVRLGVDPPRLLVKDAASSGNVYVYRYAPQGDEPQAQDLLLTADLQDVQGLLAANRTVGQVRFDFTTPGILSPSLSGSPARTGGVLELAFTASEPLSAEPVVKVAGTAMTKVTARSSGLSYVFTYVSSGTEDQAPAGLPITVDLVDAGGNVAAGLVPAAAVFDRTPPALAGAPAVLPAPPAAASTGTLVRASFTASEDLRADPLVRLGTVLLDKGAQAGRTYTYGHVAAAADGEGAKALSFELEDLAGNTATVAGPAVALDFGPPTVSALTLCADDATAAPCAASSPVFSARTGHDALKVSFTLSEPPGPGFPAVTFGTTVLPAAACTVTGLAVVCRHTVTDPAAGADPRVETTGVYVEAADAAGNRSLATVFATLDFKPPGLAGKAVLERCDAYGPARRAQDDLWTKARASYGCEYAVSAGKGPVRVSFTLDEPVAFQPYASGVTLVDTDAGAGGFWLDPDTSSPTQFDAVMTVTPPEGVRTVRAHVTDPVGNEAVLDLGTLRVDTTPPAAVDTGTAGRVVYERYPWGANATGGSKAFYLRAAAGAATPGVQVVAYDGEDLASAAAIGRTTSFVDGSFGGPPGSSVAFSIASGNVPEVFAVQEDAAGNPSAPALVWDGEWVATPGYKVPGDTLSNPSVLAVNPAFRDARYAATQLEPANAGLLGRSNQAELATVGAPDLRDVTPRAGVPSARGHCAAAWDGDAGRIVVHGGSSSIRAASSYNTTYYGDTWSFDSGRWTLLQTTGSPGGRDGHAMAHDPARQRTVLFGGTGASGTLLDTWELSGTRWRRVCWPGCATGTECSCTRSPPAALGFAFFDATSARVIGVTRTGTAQTWAWDGTDWTQLAPAHQASSPIVAAASPELGTAVALGATGTWTWTGSDWAGPAALPAFDTNGHNFTLGEVVLWWDPGQARYLAWDPFPNQLFAWTGSAWSAAPAPAAQALDDTFVSCGAYSRDERAYLRFGGCFNGFCNVPEGGVRDTTLHLVPEAAVVLTPGVQPAARTRATLADFRDQGVAWLTRGIGTGVDPYSDDWSWDGLRWVQRGTTSLSYVDAAMGWLGAGRLIQYGGIPVGPSGYFGIAPFTTVLTAPGTAWGTAYLDPEPDAPGGSAPGDQALAWDPARGAVFFGSTARATWSATWTTNPSAGVLWTPRPSALTPPSVRGHRMAYCAGAGGVVLFGGVNGAGALLDQTWRFSGTWTQLSPAVRPPARSGHVIFCDERRDKVYLFGGTGAAGPLGDLWQFDGTAWTQLSPSSLPDARSGAAGAFLSARGRGVLFGGSGSGLAGDTWDFDGGRDRRPAHVFHASFASASTGPTAISGVGATWAAMAASTFADPGPSYLADLRVRDGDLWRPVGGGNFAGAPITWATEADPAWTALAPEVRAARLRALLGGDRMDLSLAATPHGTNDVLSPGATLATTYLEAQVRYRLLCLAPGARSTNAARCCSGVAFGTTCQ